MDRGAWQAPVYRVSQGRAQLSVNVSKHIQSGKGRQEVYEMCMKKVILKKIVTIGIGK